MKHFTEKNIAELQQRGLIRSFTKTGKNYSTKSPKNIPSRQSKALEWLKWNLQYWANEKALTIETEHRFCDRGWRFDFAFPSSKIAVEYEGGIFLPKSGHNTARHYSKDTEKYNKAVVLGWRVIRVTAMNYTTVLKTLNEMI